MSRKPIAIDHFHVTQQLGFKMVLHCWCGEVLDLNLPLKSRMSIRKWMREHEQCELPIDGYGMACRAEQGVIELNVRLHY